MFFFTVKCKSNFHINVKQAEISLTSISTSILVDFTLTLWFSFCISCHGGERRILMSAHKHLTLEDRIMIHRGLDNSSSRKSIADTSVRISPLSVKKLNFIPVPNVSNVLVFPLKALMIVSILQIVALIISVLLLVIVFKRSLVSAGIILSAFVMAVIYVIPVNLPSASMMLNLLIRNTSKIFMTLGKALISLLLKLKNLVTSLSRISTMVNRFTLRYLIIRRSHNAKNYL